MDQTSSLIHRSPLTVSRTPGHTRGATLPLPNAHSPSPRGHTASPRRPLSAPLRRQGRARHQGVTSGGRGAGRDARRKESHREGGLPPGSRVLRLVSRHRAGLLLLPTVAAVAVFCPLIFPSRCVKPSTQTLTSLSSDLITPWFAPLVSPQSVDPWIDPCAALVLLWVLICPRLAGGDEQRRGSHHKQQQRLRQQH